MRTVSELNKEVTIMMRTLQVAVKMGVGIDSRQRKRLDAALSEFRVNQDTPSPDYRLNARLLERIIGLVESLPFWAANRGVIRENFELDKPLLREYGLALKEEKGIESGVLIHCGESRGEGRA